MRNAKTIANDPMGDVLKSQFYQDISRDTERRAAELQRRRRVVVSHDPHTYWEMFIAHCQDRGHRTPEQEDLEPRQENYHGIL